MSLTSKTGTASGTAWATAWTHEIWAFPVLAGQIWRLPAWSRSSHGILPPWSCGLCNLCSRVSKRPIRRRREANLENCCSKALTISGSRKDWESDQGNPWQTRSPGSGNPSQQICRCGCGLLVTSIVPREVTMMSVEIPSIGFGQHGSGCSAPHPCQGGSEVPKAQGCFVMMEAVELVQKKAVVEAQPECLMRRSPNNRQSMIHHGTPSTRGRATSLFLNAAPIRACNPIGSQ